MTDTGELSTTATGSPPAEMPATEAPTAAAKAAPTPADAAVAASNGSAGGGEGGDGDRSGGRGRGQGRGGRGRGRGGRGGQGGKWRRGKGADYIPDYSTLLPKTQIAATVRAWVDDDMPSFDIGGLVVGAAPKQAQLWMKSPGVFAGKPFFEAVFAEVGCTVRWEKAGTVEGRHFDASAEKKILLATVLGPANLILRGERTALCALSRCSGVATASREAVALARDTHGWGGLVAGTRKTTPGFRIVEKYGLLVGGAATHRLDLSQMVMLKDNHIWAAGSIADAVQLARKAAGFSQKIEVECRDLSEAIEAAGAGADVVMLDNYEPALLKDDARTLKEKYPHLTVEASGGITTETMGDYLSEHVDVVSRGNLTQGYACLDYSLKIKR